MARTRVTIVAAALALAACGGTARHAPPPPPRPVAVDAAHRLPAASAQVRRAAPVGGLTCGAASAGRYGVHVELFVDGLVVLLPSGIGVAPPLAGDAPYVTGGRCSYPLRTLEPTGVVEVAARGRPLTLGDLFAVWGQPLGIRGFGRWRAAPGERLGVFVNGVRFAGDPRTVPLDRHAEIVLEVGSPRVVPHARYRFAPGL
jgi:hypothetical protein